MNDAAHKVAKDVLAEFKINTCSSLNSSGIDAVHEILPMIHGISTLIEMGFRKRFDGTSALDEVNPEVVAAAFDGISHLTALAMYHALRL